MRIGIVIPAFNEGLFLAQTLHSIVSQTLLPKEVIVVDDNSTDNTAEVASTFAKAHAFIKVVKRLSTPNHQPGGKVVLAFNEGFSNISAPLDVIMKLDADIVLPETYLEQLAQHFQNHPQTGMAGGVAVIEKNGAWEVEQLTNKDHIRGAFKAYRIGFFNQMGGLPAAMGWDTYDELIAKFYDWDVFVNPQWELKHLKPTGKVYHKKSHTLQGKAFYQLGYGFLLTCIASLKLALKKRKWPLFVYYLQGYVQAFFSKEQKLVTKAQEKFIRKIRWQGVFQKIKGA